MRVGIIGGSVAGCAAAALLHRAGHDVTVFERSESGLVSRGAGILMHAAAWQDMTARGLLDATVPACRAGYSRVVTRAAGTGRERWLGDIQLDTVLFNWAHLHQSLRRRVPGSLYRGRAAVERIEARRTAPSCTSPGAVHRTSTSSCAPTGTARWDAGSLTLVARLPTGASCCGAGSSPSATPAPMPSAAAISCGPCTREATGFGTARHVASKCDRIYVLMSA